MVAKDQNGNEIKVGDMVGFKSDYEQVGEVRAIDKKGVLALYHEDGFGGNYLRYAKYAYEPAQCCWKE